MSDEDPDITDGEIIDVEPEKPARQVQQYQAPAAPAHPLDADPAHFQQQLQRRGDNYASLVHWLVENLDPDRDVMRVHFVKREKCDDGGPPRCTVTTNPWHWSEPDLSRSGVEKVCGLLGLMPRFLGMQDFRRQALRGVKIEEVIIECQLASTPDGPAISEGTGACNVSEVGNSVNNAMKRACKRAHADALKRTAGLSGLATELSRRMAPPDPERAAQRAQDAQARARHTGQGGGRWNTGAELTHWPIGQHKDKPLRELPTQYLEWAVKEMADKPDLLRAAAEELTKRRDAAGSDSTHTQPSPASNTHRSDQEDYFNDDIPF